MIIMNVNIFIKDKNIDIHYYIKLFPSEKIFGSFSSQFFFFKYSPWIVTLYVTSLSGEFTPIV